MHSAYGGVHDVDTESNDDENNPYQPKKTKEVKLDKINSSTVSYSSVVSI